MCEGLEICPTTGKSIEDAPCRAIQGLMETCKARIGDFTSTMIQTTTREHGGVSFSDFLSIASRESE